MQVDSLKTSHEHPVHEDLIEKKISEICNFEDNTSQLSQALKYHFGAGGSRTRAGLTYKFAKNFLMPDQDAVSLACVPELLHNASLIHDDLQDHDIDRRGCLSVWKKYGPDIAICAGDFLISAAYSVIADLRAKNSSQIIRKVHANVHDVIKGQIDDLSQDKNQSLHDIFLYEEISSKKSGPLLALSLTLPLLYTERVSFIERAERAFYHYAIAYQIYDDMHDFDRDQSKIGMNSGLNIITIMQQNGETGPIKAAKELALKHLTQAAEVALQLPFPSASILDAELKDMREKFQAFRTE